MEYEVILTGPFTHLREASTYAAEEGKLLLQVAILVTGTARPVREGGGVSDGLKSVRGKCRVSKCRLQFDCPIAALNLSGQTSSVDLSSHNREPIKLNPASKPGRSARRVSR